MNADELINEKDITIEKIKEIYSSAFIRIEPHESGESFYVNEGRPGFNVILENDLFLIRYLCYFDLTSNLDEPKILKCINRINQQFRLIRTSFEDKNNKQSINFDCYISYKGGITPYHLINDGRIFQTIVSSILLDEDIQKLFSNV